MDQPARGDRPQASQQRRSAQGPAVRRASCARRSSGCERVRSPSFALAIRGATATGRLARGHPRGGLRHPGREPRRRVRQPRRPRPRLLARGSRTSVDRAEPPRLRAGRPPTRSSAARAPRAASPSRGSPRDADLARRHRGGRRALGHPRHLPRHAHPAERGCTTSPRGCASSRLLETPSRASATGRARPPPTGLPRAQGRFTFFGALRGGHRRRRERDPRQESKGVLAGSLPVDVAIAQEQKARFGDPFAARRPYRDFVYRWTDREGWRGRSPAAPCRCSEATAPSAAIAASVATSPPRTRPAAPSTTSAAARARAEAVPRPSATGSGGWTLPPHGQVERHVRDRRGRAARLRGDWSRRHDLRRALSRDGI